MSVEPDFLHETDFRRYRRPLLLGPVAAAAVAAWPTWAWSAMAVESSGWVRAALLLGVGLCGLVVAGLTASALWLLAVARVYHVCLAGGRLRLGCPVPTRWSRFDVPVADIARLVIRRFPLDGGETATRSTSVTGLSCP